MTNPTTATTTTTTATTKATTTTMPTTTTTTSTTTTTTTTTTLATTTRRRRGTWTMGSAGATAGQPPSAASAAGGEDAAPARARSRSRASRPNTPRLGPRGSTTPRARRARASARTRGPPSRVHDARRDTRAHSWRKSASGPPPSALVTYLSVRPTRGAEGDASGARSSVEPARANAREVPWRDASRASRASTVRDGVASRADGRPRPRRDSSKYLTRG